MERLQEGDKGRASFEGQLEELLVRVRDIGRKVEFLLAERDFDTKVPLSLRHAAQVCHVELAWLRERVSRKDIVAYRSGDGAPWRVFPKDVRSYLMRDTNQRTSRRKSVLR